MKTGVRHLPALTSREGWATGLILLLMASALTGCGRPKMSQADREQGIQEGLESIEIIKNDRTMSPRMKRDLIERIQIDIDELKEPNQ